MCTPGFDLPSYFLGVRPLEDGLGRFAVAPLTAGLEWAEGVFPSARGDIAVAWRFPAGNDRANAFELTVEVPAGCQAQLVAPARDGRAPVALALDGIPASAGELSVGPGAHTLIARY